MVYLDKDSHTYINEDTNESYVSVTTVLSEYKEKFESEKIAGFVAKKHGKDVKDVLEEWSVIRDTASDYGTNTHDTIEKYLKRNRFYFPSNDEEKNIIKSLNELDIDYGEKYYPEKILHSSKHKIAGTADLVIDIDYDYFDIGDWKTNKEFTYYSKYDKYLLSPIDYLQDCHYNIYYSNGFCAFHVKSYH